MKKKCIALWAPGFVRIVLLQVALMIISSNIVIAHTYKQGPLDRPITCQLQDMPLKGILLEIEKLASIKFAYSGSMIDLTEKTTLITKEKKLSTVLDELLAPRAIRYELGDNNFIILKTMLKAPKSSKTSSSDPNSTKEQTDVGEFEKTAVVATGTVTDVATKDPIPGVNVVIKGTTFGTTTDANGKYSIDAKDTDVLLFSFIGYKTYETALNGRTTIDVTLEEDVSTLKEVVVNAGYWKVKDTEQTGNIARVTAEEIGKQPISNPLQSLIGRIPGVQITQQTGVPGGGFIVRIRGKNSIANANHPLYIIDGVQFTSTPLSPGTIGGSGTNILGDASPLNSINPADIESIDVLKDADATAIYGSRGANGVILITTKRGKAGKTKIDANIYSGAGKVTRMMDVLNTKQYLEMRREAFKNDGFEPSADRAPDLLLWDTTRDINWQKRMIGGTAHVTSAQLGISGGTANTQFLISGGYYKETTVFPGDFGLKKGSIHSTLNHRSEDQKLNIMLSTSYVADDNNLFNIDMTSAALTTPPNMPEFLDINGNLAWAPGSYTNPYADLKRKYAATTNNLVSNLLVGYQLLPGLQVKTSLGYTQMRRDEIQTNPLRINHPALIDYYQASANVRNSSIKTWVIEPQAEYQKPIWGGDLTFLVGATFQENIQEGKLLTGTGFSTDALLENIGAAENLVVDPNYTQYRYNAFFGRINYNWQGKYLINFTARRDGSSRFGTERRFANFGAVGVAWIFSNEGFIKNGQSFLSFGKIRASYGTTGNDQIGDYQYLDTYTLADNSYQGSKGLVPTRIFNPDLAWERNKKLEGALELGFLENRITLATSYYRNRSDNQLVGYALPPSTGFLSVQRNLPALVENSGLEFELSTTNIRTENFTWTTSGNLSLPRNTLLEFPNIEESSFATVYEVGQSLFMEKAYHSLGADPQTGVYTFQDVDGEEGISYPNDLQVTKTLGEKYSGGINNSFTYRGFQLDFFFQFVKQTGISYINGFLTPGFMSNQPTDVLNRWQQPGDIADIQRFTQQAGTPAWFAYFFDSRFYGDNRFTDASFIRLKNVSLSYQLPKEWTRKASIQSSRVYIQGQNLLTITNYIGMDPESQSVSSLPPLRMMTAGIQITL